jgi:peptidoglycan/LPS O-acetylase OafA/YrhL
LTASILQDVILPFVLIFTLTFAILQKSKLLGEGKNQIDALISLVIAGILIAFSKYVDWIKEFSLFLVITLFLVFVFMMIYGFIYGTKEGDPFKDQKWIKIALGIIVFAALVVAGLVITGAWSKVYEFFASEEAGANAVFIILIVAAIVAVIFGGKKSGDEEKK